MLKIVSLNYRTNVDNFEKKKKLLEKIEELIKDYQSSLENSFSGSYLSSY